MTDIEITFDQKTGFYDALILKKGIATQGKSLDALMGNITDAFSLSKNK